MLLKVLIFPIPFLMTQAFLGRVQDLENLQAKCCLPTDNPY